MNSVLDIAWSAASPFKPCAVCRHMCTTQKMLICCVCEKVYHADCYDKKESSGLDCNCHTVLPFSSGRAQTCIVTSCTNPPNCKKSRNWTCLSCYDNILCRLTKWILFQKQSINEVYTVIRMFLRSVQTPMCIENINDSNVHYLAISASILTLMYESVYLNVFIHTDNSIRITHVFNTLLKEMKTTGDIYHLPFSKHNFCALDQFSDKDAINVLSDFKTHIRSLATPVMPVPIIKFLNTRRVKYISKHQITDKETLLGRLRDSGFQGIPRHLLLSEYKDAIYDLHALEMANEIWVTGDRKIVYTTKKENTKITGLLETWQSLQNQTKTMNKN